MLIVWFAVLLICGCVSTYRTNYYYHYPTAPLICGKNEEPFKCVPCPPRTCDSIFTSYNCTGCEPGCDCIDLYLRNSNGLCVPNEECFAEPQCDIPSKCRPTCAVPNPPGCQYTPSETNQDGCNCQPGFILSEVGGKCIEVEQCPTDIGCNGDPNALVRQNPFPCPSTCDSPNARPCKKKSNALGCQCKPGYILSEADGKCILPNDCKGGNPCGQNGTFLSCRVDCPFLYCPENDNRGIIACDPPPPAFCMGGCVCTLNHRIKGASGPISALQ